MNSFLELIISRDLTIREAIKKLDSTAKKILIVTDKEGKLEGTITDGDIRRWILKNGDLSEESSIIMSKDPIYLYEKDIKKLEKIFNDSRVEAIPILDNSKIVKDIVFWHENINLKKNKLNKDMDIPVVIMAGGKGSRLKPYTNILPKPLIPIGEVPIIERIMNKFEVFGFNEFIFTVNYKKDMIKSYFKDSEKNYNIQYIVEDKPLGTAGSLYMLKNKIKGTFILSNCDILIDADYLDILEEHKKNNNKMTIVTSLKNYKIPYGVIETTDLGEFKNILEKPEFDFLVNTGMYILEDTVLNDIPEDQFYHITDLISLYIEKEEKIGVYPISESKWLDMGEFKEMENMIEKLGV